MESFFIILFDLVGTFAFAISGIRLAAVKQVDWFGAYVIGLATAIGGGTVRDLLIDVTPFWMLDGKYLLTTGFALLVCLVFKEKLLRWRNPLYVFDAIGLGLFTVVGITKSLEAGLPFWVCIVMGTVTGSVGGIMRDVLLNEVPLILRKEIYALACVAGGLGYLLCIQLNFSTSLKELTAALIVIAVRLMSLKFHIQLPVLKSTRQETGKIDKHD